MWIGGGKAAGGGSSRPSDGERAGQSSGSGPSESETARERERLPQPEQERASARAREGLSERIESGKLHLVDLAGSERVL